MRATGTQVIVVLGMHRSGTSALTRALGALGARLGPEAELRKNSENLPLRRINEQLLSVGGGTWDAPPEPGWLDTRPARRWVDEGRRTLTDQLGTAGIAVWKDPRTCVTLPFWLNILDDPVFVLVHRHPEEIAGSLAARNSLGPAHAYALWERHNADALRSVTGRPVVVVAYADLLAAPVSTLTLISETLAARGVVLPGDPTTTAHGLRPDERHHNAGKAHELRERLATASQRELFGQLRDLGGGYDRLELSAPVPELHPISVELLALARAVRIGRQERRLTRRQRRHPAPRDPPY